MKLLEHDLKNSFELWDKIVNRIPTGTQTLSKAPNQFVEGVYPMFLEKGKGSHVWDVDGNEYIDYPSSLGAILLGYSYPRVNDAIKKQLDSGTIFSLMNRLEGEVAEMLAGMIPCAEQIRFAKTGSEAASGAIRVARAATGRYKIAYCGYHGWHDWYTVTTTRSKGIPPVLKDYMLPFEYNNTASLEKIFSENPKQIAAVIMEPVALLHPQEQFLQKVRDLTTQNGAVLIFDEIITGFRFGKGGAQERYGVTPDLATFGKAVANGMPLAILAGKKEFMKECHEIFFSSTFGGETLSLAAAKSVLQEMREKPVVEHIWQQGEKLQKGLSELARAKGLSAELIGFPARHFLVFKDGEGNPSLLLKALFWQETIQRGVLFGNAQMISFSHSDSDIAQTLQVCEEALEFVKNAVASGAPEKHLKGKVPTEIFRKP